MANLRALKKTMHEAGTAAASIQLRYLGKPLNIERKSPIDLVTQVDARCEKIIIKTILRDFPDHGILAEESGEEKSQQSEYRWVIDPLDGTTNFSHSNPVFAVSIALQKNEQTIMALVIDPTRNETFFAQRGKGAFMNRRRIHVSQTAKLSEALLATGFPYRRREDPRHLTRIIEGFLMKSHGVVRLGAAALDLCWVACGRLDGFWEEGLHAWDVAAGNLIIQEAGGKVSGFDGRAYRLFQDDIVCSNTKIHRAICRTVRENWKNWQ